LDVVRECIELDDVDHVDDEEGGWALAAAELIAAARDGILDGVPAGSHHAARALSSQLTSDILLHGVESGREDTRLLETADLRAEAEPDEMVRWQQHISGLVDRLSPKR